ncbi:hypothetical protein OIU77_024900 [Salix suchowensis]|uniref:Uncharacterized protein n=1 Tax=Salix suchowensis TaxID=1278906 RepID=A0ABQ9BX93_9ROSI|nr:hypothetical protein OIU77_024900 [Salix suchowensis]
MRTEFWKQVPPNEPYRVILGDVRDKLNNTRERSRQLLANGKSDIPENSIFTNAEQVPSLPITFSSRKFKFSIPVLLQGYKMEIHCYDGSRLEFLRQVSTFGLSLVRLDIRQESDRDTDILDPIENGLRSIGGNGSSMSSVANSLFLDLIFPKLKKLLMYLLLN